MALKIYNTMKRHKEDFVPLKPGKVGMYACGVTVYDFSHIGHARAIVVFDAIQRYLRHRGYEVTYVRNYTDIDDKIIRRAHEESVPFSEISERFIKEFDTDMDALGVEPPTHQPRATEHISDMIAMISTLIEKQHAYEIDGDIYFDVSSFAGYGKLSGKNIDDLQSGARIEVDERKKNPLDFALWKKSKQGEPFWESPWGKGRPGWHIECSVMSHKYLGAPFDIHGGGSDLIFPHHENEIAQAECATGTAFARYWVHNGFVNINQEKMSKSLKNFFTIRDVLKTCHPETLRLFLLSHHYRSPVDFCDENMRTAQMSLDRFYTILHDVQQLDKAGAWTEHGDREENPVLNELTAFPDKFTEALDDDFNTAAALGRLHSLAKTINGLIDLKKKNPSLQISRDFPVHVRRVFEAAGSVLGIFKQDPAQYFEQHMQEGISASDISAEDIQALIDERTAARKNKDWQKADDIRDRLAAHGVILKDSPQGTRWSFRKGS